jgi:2-oxoglutarate decarboxylase
MINLNTAFEDEIYERYREDPLSVSPAWRDYFDKKNRDSAEYYDGSESNLISAAPVKKKLEAGAQETNHIYIDPGAELEQLSSIQSRIADNMQQSTEIPTATSMRAIPVKALDENRRIINRYLVKLKRQRVSFTHILAWATVKTLMKYPQMNSAYTVKEGIQYRIKRKAINIGFAVDIIKKDGTRLLLVPNVKNAQNMLFSGFIEAYDKIISKTRDNKLDVDDLAGTTVTLTNPGMIGTTGSSPRLMKGQGLIVATGSIDYPVEYQAVRPEILTSFAISKVVNITNTYDHRIIQGAESAEFLSYLSKLLLGENQFYDQLFASLKIPFEPIRWTKDNTIVNRFGQIDEKEAIEKAAHVMLMINAYRVRGHLLASVNPLGFESYYYPELDPAYYGFTIWDLDRIFHAEDTWESNNLPLRDIIEILRETYCGSSGIEFMHIQDPVKKQWIMRQWERTKSITNYELRITNERLDNLNKDKGDSSGNIREYTKEEKINTLKKLIQAETFEHFLHVKFVGSKRFSLEGGESLIVMLDKLFENSAESDLSGIALGMAHRGRLNVLVNNIGKSAKKIFDEFEGVFDPDSYHGSGDVKYHLGDTGTYKSKNGNDIKIILSPNPSHLELVDPVIEGMARALDDEEGDTTYSKTLPILIHGDSAFAGQGIVAETLNLSQLDAYKTGGTIHIIINNQIGFTTTTGDSRSSVYCTDIGKMVQVPIIHVNGNDPEAVMTAATFAFEYRQKFGTDIIIDMLCYRKYGHNEADEPTYTQPLLYKKIKSMIPVRKIYEQELIKENILNEEEAEKYVKDKMDELNKIFGDSSTTTKKTEVRKETGNDKLFAPIKTSVPKNILETVTKAITTLPEGFKPNPKLLSLLSKRAEMLNSKEPSIDWAMAEELAFGSILLDGKQIRLSGQDTRRGTFSQRHAVLTDIETNDIYVPLNNINPNQAQLMIYDSPLSELAVLGYEYGYSTIAKDTLTLWEAQFGDFANGAQAIIDQFISCAESKWGKTSNIVLLLPHSYDGQGPEHSSARLERFLQLCADNNMLVCNLSTPAQYFHSLRRQMQFKNFKPLILMTPKSMLRLPQAVSEVIEFTNGNFKTIIDDTFSNATLANVASEKVKRILICSGKIYYEILDEKNRLNRNDIALIRIEQLYPLDIEMLNEIITGYEKAGDIIWVQEEPKNMGVWAFLEPRINEILPSGKNLRYIGRKERPASSTGSYNIHLAEQKEIIESSLV